MLFLMANAYEGQKLPSGTCFGNFESGHSSIFSASFALAPAVAKAKPIDLQLSTAPAPYLPTLLGLEEVAHLR
jgi:hypothetical protein